MDKEEMKRGNFYFPPKEKNWPEWGARELGSGETKVVNVRREHYDVYIGRGHGSIWGNPFEVGRHGTRPEVIKLYEKWILYSPDAEEQRRMLPELKGKILGCWCAPRPCHGDVLVKILNNMERNDE